MVVQGFGEMNLRVQGHRENKLCISSPSPPMTAACAFYS